MGGGSMPAARAVLFGVIAGGISGSFLLLIHLGNLGAMILVAMASLPVLMAGLGAGFLALNVAVVVGMGGVIAGNGVDFGLLFALQVVFPAVVLVSLSLARPVPPSAKRLVIGLTGLGLGVFALIYLSSWGQDGGLEAILVRETTQALQEFQKNSPVPVPPSLEVIMAKLPFWLTGMSIALWQLVIAGDAMLAQGVLTRFEWNRRITPPLASLSLPKVTSALFAASVAAWWFGSGQVSFIGANLAEILAVPLFFGGLAVIHMASRRYSGGLLLLICLYVVMLLSLLPVAFVLALGVFEQWVGLRQRMPAKPQGEI